MKSLIYMPVFLMALFSMSLSACQAKEPPVQPLPRNEKPPLFQPHMADFPCKIEAAAVPPIDAQADQWFRESLALDSADIYTDDKDYQSIVRLMQQAAQRRHWKAMLNLASLYIERRDRGRGVEDAVKLVEEAMRLGVPAAYDRMGTYYINGTGVRRDATRAYAFWQKAALMGNPQAMAYLGDKLRAVSDDIMPGYWSNIPIAIKMLECSLAQGYGPAADPLRYLYMEPMAPDGKIAGEANVETRRRALQVLHQGVKLGCSVCAVDLSIEFGRPFKPSQMFAPFIDKARSERYRVLARALEFNPDFRFPNLDQVLPLPPATIPAWNGERRTLLEAAMGVNLSSLSSLEKDSLQSNDLQIADGVYNLWQTSEISREIYSPCSGYWQPTVSGHPELVQQQVAGIRPRCYEIGDIFKIPYFIDKKLISSGLPVIWRRWVTMENDNRIARFKTVQGATREVAHTLTLMQCQPDAICPVSGVWQPWIDPTHSLHGTISQYWRQSWVLEGQSFPDPVHDWRLDVPAHLITWHLMDAQGVNTCRGTNV